MIDQNPHSANYLKFIVKAKDRAEIFMGVQILCGRNLEKKIFYFFPELKLFFRDLVKTI